jgi:hypothetical protein
MQARCRPGTGTVETRSPTRPQLLPWACATRSDKASGTLNGQRKTAFVGLDPDRKISDRYRTIDARVARAVLGNDVAGQAVIDAMVGPQVDGPGPLHARDPGRGQSSRDHSR